MFWATLHNGPIDDGRLGMVCAGEENTAGVSEALVAKYWNLLAIERLGLPVTKEMRDTRVKLLQKKGCDREAFLREAHNARVNQTVPLFRAFFQAGIEVRTRRRPYCALRCKQH